MNRLFYGNFEFEHRLSSLGQQQLPEPVRRINDELACAWVAVAEDGDFVWTPAPVEDGFFRKLSSQGLPAVEPVCDEASLESRLAGRSVELCPWGWTDSIREWAKAHRLNHAAPRQNVVREANSRRFSSQLEREWDLGLTGASVVRSVDELSAAVRQVPKNSDRWVVKAEFSMSARERFLGRGRELAEQAVNWVRRRLDTDGLVFFEPWVDKLEEAGLQFSVPKSGTPMLEGVTPLLTDQSGLYRGSRFAFDAEVPQQWRPAVDIGMRVAERLQNMGYFGPLGIDAVRYRDPDGYVRLRPLQDVNARYTMGRLSLGFRRLLHEGETGSWLHPGWPADSLNSAPPVSPRDATRGVFGCELAEQQLPAGARLIRTSPFVVGGRPTQHGTVVVICRSPAMRNKIEATLLSLEH